MELMMTVLSVQSDRVLFSAAAEKIQGASPDARVTKEMEALFGMIQTAKDVMDDRDEVTIKAKGRGVVSSLFQSFMQGREPAEKVTVDEIIDAEIVEDSE
jgi:hypothetical protein